MRRIGHTCATLVLTLAMAGGSGADNRFAEKLQNRMPALLDHYGVPGVIVCGIENGEVAWTQTYGYANIADRVPMRPQMLVEHGSNGKAMTAWAVMRLVEGGKVNLDTPVNVYLRRWKLRSDRFNPDGVTLRRILSHTAGVTIHGFADYSPRRRLPSLVEMAEGRNQRDGPVTLAWKPGSEAHYSGGGYLLAQMVIEDTTGEPLESFVQREVTDPLGALSVRWDWTPAYSARAPTPYWLQQEPLEYRRLGCKSIGSDIATVQDLGRFIASAVRGPHGEPPGRGVLRPESVAQMISAQPGTDGKIGLGYGVGEVNGHHLISHFGGNPGWLSHYMLDTDQRDGFVLAANSARAFPLALAVQGMWLNTRIGMPEPPLPPPEPPTYGGSDTVLVWFAGAMAVACLIRGTRTITEVISGRRGFRGRPSARSVAVAGMVLLFGLAWGYWFYTPLPLPLPPSVPDFWATRQVHIFTTALAACCVILLVEVFWPRARTAGPPGGLLGEADAAKLRES